MKLHYSSVHGYDEHSGTTHHFTVRALYFREDKNIWEIKRWNWDKAQGKFLVPEPATGEQKVGLYVSNIYTKPSAVAVADANYFKSQNVMMCSYKLIAIHVNKQVKSVSMIPLWGQ